MRKLNSGFTGEVLLALTDPGMPVSAVAAKIRAKHPDWNSAWVVNQTTNRLCSLAKLGRIAVLRKEGAVNLYAKIPT